MALRTFSRLITASAALSGIAQALPFNETLSVLDIRSPGKVAVAGNPVVMDAGGIYIRVSQMSDGSLVGGYAAQDGSDHVLRVVRSWDGASSWTRVGEVSRGNSDQHDIDNAMPLQLPSGRLVYAFRNHDRDTTKSPPYSYYRLTVCYSDDGGYTWAYLSTIVERTANGYNGCWEPFLRIARDGTLQVYYSCENSQSDQDNYMRRSTDGGATWSSPYSVSGGDRTSRDGMSCAAPIDNNGNLIAVFENTEDGPFSIDAVISHDDGLTWGGRKRLYTASGGKNAGAPYVHNVWGTLVVSFMTNEGTNLAQLDDGYMKVITSTDGGNSWSGSVVVSDNAIGAHWGSLFNRDSTHFLALYSKDGMGAVSQLFELQN